MSTAGDRLPECPPISPLWEWDVETSQAKHKSVEHVPSLELVLRAQKHWVLYRLAVAAPLGELAYMLEVPAGTARGLGRALSAAAALPRATATIMTP